MKEHNQKVLARSVAAIRTGLAEGRRWVREAWAAHTKFYAENPQYKMAVDGTVEVVAIAILKKPGGIRKISALALTALFKK